MTIVSVTLALSFGLAVDAHAQGEFEFEMKVLSGMPMGRFGNHVGQTIWGGSFSGAYHFRGAPLSIGVQVGVARYGRELPDDIPGHPIGPDSGTSYAYKMFLSHMILRYDLPPTRVSPYLEALIGMNVMLTERFLGTTSTIPYFTPNMIMMIESEDSETVLARVTPSYGMGGGLRFRVIEFGEKRRGNRGPVSLSLNLQGRYLFGGRIEYLREGAISFEDGKRRLDISRTRTDMLLFNVGLSIRGQGR